MQTQTTATRWLAILIVMSIGRAGCFITVAAILRITGQPSSLDWTVSKTDDT